MLQGIFAAYLQPVSTLFFRFFKASYQRIFSLNTAYLPAHYSESLLVRFPYSCYNYVITRHRINLLSQITCRRRRIFEPRGKCRLNAGASVWLFAHGNNYQEESK